MVDPSARLRAGSRGGCLYPIILGLAVDPGHHGFGIAISGGGAFGEDFIDAPEVFRGQLDIQRANIFFQIRAALGAGDGHDIFALGQDPSQSELRGSAGFFFGDFFDALY